MVETVNGAVAVRSRTIAAGQRRSVARGTRNYRQIWWPFVVPTVILTIAFFLLPFFLNIYFAFTQWTGFSSEIKINGLDNFIALTDAGVLWNAIRLTLIFAFVASVMQNAVSISLALLLQKTDPFNSVIRSLFFIPVLISPLAAGYIWAALLAPAGAINQAIALLVPGFNFAWLGNPTSALITVAFIDVWKWSGIVTLVYIAGLNAIPSDLIEAAKIDGANAWQRFWRVRFPLLAPAFTFSVVVSFLGALSTFDIVQATTNGGPGASTTLLNTAMYRQYTGGFFGTASTLSFVITVLVVVLGLPLIAYLRRREVEA